MSRIATGKDTITAIATPIGSGGIGIIRISGDHAIAIADRVFCKKVGNGPKKEGRGLKNSPSHSLAHGYICDMQTKSVIDEVLLAVMRAPHSYTREDVVEIQSHSGPIILNKILNMVINLGARLAMPGEFTKRAFLNGRIDLSQAEAVGEMVSAKSEAALKIAATNLTGNLKIVINGMIEKITGLMVMIEAGLEFPEEVGSSVNYDQINCRIKEDLLKPAGDLLVNYQDCHVFRDGIRLGIVGRPNVGKSSLLNYLLTKERAIVTPIPGTTRDLIEEHICLDGIPMIISDTAGLHETQDPVEIIGIQKARENINSADLVLFVIDAEEPFLDSDIDAFEKIGEKNIIVVVNKLDLITNAGQIEVPKKISPYPVVFVSAKYGQGIGQLKALITREAVGHIRIEPGGTIIPNMRQKKLLEFVVETLGDLQSNIDNGVGEELIVNDLGLAKDALNEIVGGKNNEDILDAVFSRFCIGK